MFCKCIWYLCKTTRYQNVKLKLSDLELDKLKSAIKKDDTEVTLRLSSHCTKNQVFR